MTDFADPALLARAREGDDAAVEALLVRHAPRVLRFARSICRDSVLADDIAQDSLVTAARALKDVRADAALSSWFYAVVRSHCRRRNRRGKHAPTELLVDVPLADHRPGPEALAADRELGVSLRGAIAVLDPKYRDVLLLRDVEGLTAPEVAEVLGLQVDTVKTRLHRARAAVRSRIEPQLERSRARTPACFDVVERFSRYLEGEIGAVECSTLHAHVEGCPSCNAACASLRRTLSACKAAGDEIPEDVEARVRLALATVVGLVNDASEKPGTR